MTCGIYGLYWLYTLTEDVNKLTGDPNATSGGIVILLSLVTCGIYSWYWLYKQANVWIRSRRPAALPPATPACSIWFWALSD